MYPGTCDNCTNSKKESDMSREAFLLMACIQSCGGHWGLNLPVDVLRGSRVSFPAVIDKFICQYNIHGNCVVGRYVICLSVSSSDFISVVASTWISFLLGSLCWGRQVTVCFRDMGVWEGVNKYVMKWLHNRLLNCQFILFSYYS